MKPTFRRPLLIAAAAVVPALLGALAMAAVMVPAAGPDATEQSTSDEPAAGERSADELPEWLRHDIGTFGGAGTRVASEVYYMVTGPDYEENGFEIELVRPKVRTGSM